MFGWSSGTLFLKILLSLELTYLKKRLKHEAY